MTDEETKKEQAWQQAHPIPGINPDEWRWDAYGYTICKKLYGSKECYGWEIKHILPTDQDPQPQLVTRRR